jgi:hypothetical protein
MFPFLPDFLKKASFSYSINILSILDFMLFGGYKATLIDFSRILEGKFLTGLLVSHILNL